MIPFVMLVKISLIMGVRGKVTQLRGLKNFLLEYCGRIIKVMKISTLM
jgi:hypothetical protein